MCIRTADEAVFLKAALPEALHPSAMSSWRTSPSLRELTLWRHAQTWRRYCSGSAVQPQLAKRGDHSSPTRLKPPQSAPTTISSASRP